MKEDMSIHANELEHSLSLEDATSYSKPSRTVDERRFVKDEQLLQALGPLARHGHFQSVKLHFEGRRRVDLSDKAFIRALVAIKADKVEFVERESEFEGSTLTWPSKQAVSVEEYCSKMMVGKHSSAV
jgi:hypothetical protein